MGKFCSGFLKMWYFCYYTNTDASALTLYDKKKHTHIFEKSQNTTYLFSQQKQKQKNKNKNKNKNKKKKKKKKTKQNKTKKLVALVSIVRKNSI